MSNISNNQREVPNVKDSVSGVPFPLKGNSSDGSLNVNVTSIGGSGLTVSGNKSNNGGVAGATNLGVLPAIANAAAPSYTEGNQVGLSTDLAGNLRVTGSLSVGGTTDNSAFTAGTSTGTPAMGFYHSTIDTVTDGRSAAVAITSKRAIMVNLQNAAGTEIGTATTPVQVSLANTAANATAVKVDGSAVTQPVSIAATVGTNVAQINGNTTATGNGVVGTGVQRVAIASDNTAFSVNATLNAETTKVIGTVRNADGSGNLWTSNSTTFTAKFAQDVNMLGTLGTAFTTAGKVDVKGADGDVFVRQATAANLNATVVGTGTFAVQATLAAETTKVIGVTRSADGSGNLLTSTGNALDVNLKTSAATNISTNLAQVNGVTTLAGNGASGTGAQRVTIASDSTGQIAPAANATATGTSIYNNTALSNTKQAVNASAGNLYGYHIYNPNSVVIYIQIWNVASASVTVGTTTPTAVIAVPPGGWADAPPSGPPIAFATALTIAATTTATGSGAPTTALLCNMWYK